MPLAAVAAGGRVRVSSGSTTARVGRRRGWLLPDFTWIRGRPARTPGSTPPRCRPWSGPRPAAFIGRFDLSAVVHLGLETSRPQDPLDPPGDAGGRDARVGDQQHSLDPELSNVVVQLVGGADAELDRRGTPGEDGLSGKLHHAGSSSVRRTARPPPGTMTPSPPMTGSTPLAARNRRTRADAPGPACYASAQTPSSFPLGSVKWNRRPPGNSYGPFTTWPPACFTAATDRSRSVEYSSTNGPPARTSWPVRRPPTSGADSPCGLWMPAYSGP